MPFNVIADKNPGFGAWSGFQTALAASKREMTFILACDLPLVSGDLLKRLVNAASDGNAVAAVPLQPDGRVQPLCGIYRTIPVLKAVEETIDRAEHLPSLISFVRELGSTIVGPSGNTSSHEFLNVNTREDLEKAKFLRS